MATATERIPVLVTRAEKARIASMARRANVSMGEFLRRAADAFQPSEDEAALEGIIGQVLKTTEQASRAIDDALEFVAASNQRIEAMERRHKGELV